MDYFGDFRTVDSHIKRLREKLKTEQETNWQIKTVWGKGYLFEVENEKQPKIMTRLILTYTLVLSFFAIVVLIIFFSLFNQQAHVIHGEKMKEQGDKIAEILVKDNYLEEEKNEEDNLSHHERMMKRNNHMSNTTDYLSLISQLSTDEIYVVNETGEFLSTSHMTKKQQNTLTDSGNTILNELKQNKQATFLKKIVYLIRAN